MVKKSASALVSTFAWDLLLELVLAAALASAFINALAATSAIESIYNIAFKEDEDLAFIYD